VRLTCYYRSVRVNASLASLSLSLPLPLSLSSWKLLFCALTYIDYLSSQSLYDQPSELSRSYLSLSLSLSLSPPLSRSLTDPYVFIHNQLCRVRRGNRTIFVFVGFSPVPFRFLPRFRRKKIASGRGFYLFSF